MLVPWRGLRDRQQMVHTPDLYHFHVIMGYGIIVYLLDICADASTESTDGRTALNVSARLADDDTDWLHSNLTYQRDTRFVEEFQNLSKRSRDSYEKKRQHDRDMYSSMTGEEKEVWLHKNREYKKSIRETSTSSHHNDIAFTTPGSTIEQTGLFIYLFILDSPLIVY